MRKIRYTRPRYGIYCALIMAVALGWWAVMLVVPAPYARGVAIGISSSVIGSWARNNYDKFFK